jgi:hypothetical protein
MIIPIRITEFTEFTFINFQKLINIYLTLFQAGELK